MSPFALRRLSRMGTSVPPVILALDCFLYKECCPSCADRTYDSKKRRYAIYGGSRMKNEILVKYLKAGITPFHLVQQCAADLEAAGFCTACHGRSMASGRKQKVLYQSSWHNDPGIYRAKKG